MTQSRQETFASENMQENEPTLTQSFISGALAGKAEVVVNHPLWSIKTRLQRHQPFTLNPLVLYRGFMPNILSMMPISAVQVGLDRTMAKYWFGQQGEISDYQRLLTSFTAGVGSSVISCPTEMIMTTQGKKQLGFSAATFYLYREAGATCFFNGLTATAGREGMFASCYLGLMPLFRKMYAPYFADENKTGIAAGLSAGIFGSITSQAIDTIKTAQQDAELSQPLSVTNAVKSIYGKNSMFGFFKGGAARMTMVMSAICIMNNVTEAVEARFSKK